LRLRERGDQSKRHARDSRRGVPGSTAYRVLGLAKVPVLVYCLGEGCP
jgi:hypothetical protein